MRRGHELLSAYAPRAGIPLERVGALLVAWTEQEHARSPRSAARRANGYRRRASSRPEELYRRVPALGPGARAALEVPDEGIVCTFTTPLAFATEAVLARLRAAAGRPRQRRRATPTGFRAATAAADVRARMLVNAAGLFSDQLDRMLGHDAFTVTPRRGELIVFDKLAGPLLEHILLPVPSEPRRACCWPRPSTATCCSARPPRTSTTGATPSTAAGLAPCAPRAGG